MYVCMYVYVYIYTLHSVKLWWIQNCKKTDEKNFGS